MASRGETPPTDCEASRDKSNHEGITGASITRGLLRRLQFRPIKRHLGERTAHALFTFVAGTLSIAVLAAVAAVARSPFIFPSLGPTAYLLFHRPLASASSPRNTLTGHLIGALCGWAALAAFGLLGAPDVLSAGVTWAHVGAAAFSLGLTGGLMAFFRVGHPPAGATTLIVSLGLMPYLWQIPILMLAVCLLTLLGFSINRLPGIDYPIWSPPPASPGN